MDCYNTIFRKKAHSRYSTSCLMVVDDKGPMVLVRSYNFYRKQWATGTRWMGKDLLLLNYERAI